MSKRRKVLLIGWDAADWKAIDPLMDAGLMPNLEKLVNGGVRGRLATLSPPLSPMLWTSIATGKRPYKHGILGFTEVGPDGRTVRPVTNVHRKVKAIWNILTQEKKRTHVIGWWPSHPAEPINGIMISNFYQRAQQPISAPWPVRPGTVHPEHLSDLFSKLRIHPAELTAAHIQPFIPDLAQVDQEKEQSLTNLARILADCSTVHAAATYVLEHEEWDFAAVYYDAIDHIKHAFMKFHPPRRDHIPEREFELYKGVVNAAYRYHDMMLGRLLQLAGEDTTVMLISDHGFHPDHMRPRALPKEPAGPAHEHGPFGIFCLKGPGIKQDELIHGASLLDITPTLLTLFDLPVARDMDGKPLLDVFATDPGLQVIDSWEEVEGACGMHPKSLATDALSEMDRGSLQQLIDLGYIEDPGADQEQASQRTIRENRFFLAKSLMDGGRILEARGLLEDLFQEAPDQLRYAVDLIRSQLRTAQTAAARHTWERAKAEREAAHDAAIQQRTDQEKGSGSPGDPTPYRTEPALLFLLSNIMQAEGRPQEALAILEKLEQEPELGERIHLRLGHARLKAGQTQLAISSFERAIAHDPQASRAYHGLGICYLKLGDTERAVDEILQAITLSFNEPYSHYHLGEAYMRLNRFHEAAQAYQVCLKMGPGINRARVRLAMLYEKHLGDPETAAQYRNEVDRRTPAEVITIVSGLPRSGTSMMMQALVAAGMVPFTDGERAADENNPRGYLEHAAVKALARDARFLEEAQGKVVKVIAQLLPFLPPKYRYRVVFMDRDLNEVIASQRTMLEREGRTDQAKNYPVGLRDAYLKHLHKVESWLDQNPNVELIRVGYRDVINTPRESMERVNTFFQNALDLEALVQAVAPNLYRQRTEASPAAESHATSAEL